MSAFLPAHVEKRWMPLFRSESRMQLLLDAVEAEGREPVGPRLEPARALDAGYGGGREGRVPGVCCVFRMPPASV